MYRCADCGSEALVLPGLIVRPCDCRGAIIAEAEAQLVGKGGVH